MTTKVHTGRQRSSTSMTAPFHHIVATKRWDDCIPIFWVTKIPLIKLNALLPITLLTYCTEAKKFAGPLQTKHQDQDRHTSLRLLWDRRDQQLLARFRCYAWLTGALGYLNFTTATLQNPSASNSTLRYENLHSLHLMFYGDKNMYLPSNGQSQLIHLSLIWSILHVKVVKWAPSPSASRYLVELKNGSSTWLHVRINCVLHTALLPATTHDRHIMLL